MSHGAVEIKLKSGLTAIIDAEDYEKVSKLSTNGMQQTGATLLRAYRYTGSSLMLPKGKRSTTSTVTR